MATLQSLISAVHRQTVGREPDASLDFMAEFKADPALVEAARAEKARLEASQRPASQPFVGDHEGKIRHAALTRMLEQFDAQGAQPG